MRFFLVLVCIGMALAVKPVRQNSRFAAAPPTFQRFQAPPRFQAGRPFARQETPHPVYGPPANNPAQEYGPPSTAAPEEPTTTEPEAETVPGNGTDSNRLTKGEHGTYYIYHPNGLLQKVVYSTKDDARNMKYTAQVKYEDVEPIRAPIYTYDPETLVLTRFQN